MSLRKTYPEIEVHKLPSLTREYKVYGKKEVLKEIKQAYFGEVFPSDCVGENGLSTK